MSNLVKRLRTANDFTHYGTLLMSEAADEIERLHRDRRDLLEQLRHIRTHLYAATVQRSPSDDRIIADHVEQAYLRADEVIKTVEERDE